MVGIGLSSLESLGETKWAISMPPWRPPTSKFLIVPRPKMAHGGVRYLERANFQLSKDQLDLVIEALKKELATATTHAPCFLS